MVLTHPLPVELCVGLPMCSRAFLRCLEPWSKWFPKDTFLFPEKKHIWNVNMISWQGSRHKKQLRGLRRLWQWPPGLQEEIKVRLQGEVLIQAYRFIGIPWVSPGYACSSLWELQLMSGQKVQKTSPPHSMETRRQRMFIAIYPHHRYKPEVYILQIGTVS